MGHFFMWFAFLLTFTQSYRRITGWLSPPMRGRGLKRGLTFKGKHRSQVAPHAGAWIETTKTP